MAGKSVKQTQRKNKHIRTRLSAETKRKVYLFNHKIKIMNLENELLEKFQVEELEKRYEMGFWTLTQNPDGSVSVGGDNTGQPPAQTPPPDPCENDPTCGGMIHFLTPEEKAAAQEAHAARTGG